MFDGTGLVMGILVIAFGVYAFFRMGAAETAQPSKRGTFGEQFFSVFRFGKLAEMKELLFVNLTVCVFFIGFNSYFAYIGNYIIYYLGFSADQMGLIEAIPLILVNPFRNIFLYVLCSYNPCIISQR